MESEPTSTVGLVRFGQLLRTRGLSVGAGQILSYTRGVACLDPLDIRDLYWTGRITLVNRYPDLPIYDNTFEDYFVRSESDSPPLLLPVSSADIDDEGPPSVPFGTDEKRMEYLELGDEDHPSIGGPRASQTEILRTKRFDQWTDEEFDQLSRLIPEVRIPKKRGRRTRPSSRGPRIDLRRSLRHSLRYGGDLVQLRYRRRLERPRSIVLIVDVSGSMAGFSRALVQFAYGISRASRQVEVFCFGTRLTRLTHAMRVRDPNSALDEATEMVVDWDGGTRIGESVGSYVTKWGKHRFNRGAQVIICSDGLERGKPDRLARAMQRLSRQAYRIVWVNPLAGDPKFQPLARGLVAALPFIDELIAGHTIESLEDLADTLSLDAM